MNELTLFNNPEFGTVRAVEIDGEVWMAGKDVASNLKYSNPQKAIRDHVDEEDKTVNEMFTVNGTAIILINESGLYSLVLSSKMPDAKKFRRWITSEVIPSIMRAGSYSIKKETAPELPNMSVMEMIAHIANNAVETEKRLTAIETTQAEQKAYLDKVTDAFEINPKTWRQEANKLVKKIASDKGLTFQHVWVDSYKALESKANCNLHARIEHKKERMYNSGATATQINHVSTLDIIAEDNNLIQHYISVLREMAFKN